MLWRPGWVRCLSAAVVLIPLSVAAQEVGTATVVEAPMRLIRGAVMMRAPEGARLRRGDIIETAESGFAQLELAGGAIVALGPATRLFLFRRAASGTELVVLEGWVKAEISPAAGSYSCVAPALAATTRHGTVLLHANGDSAAVFIESGSATIHSVTPAGYFDKPRAGNAGQFFTRGAGQDVTVSSRPTSGFLEAMPRQFRDTLPSRLSHFAGKAAAPRPEHEVTYAEVEMWLTAKPAWRGGFVERFEPRLKDTQFRQAVDAHMRDHPEWDPILHPEKYEPQTAAGKQAGSTTDMRRESR